MKSKKKKSKQKSENKRNETDKLDQMIFIIHHLQPFLKILVGNNCEDQKVKDDFKISKNILKCKIGKKK